MPLRLEFFGKQKQKAVCAISDDWRRFVMLEHTRPHRGCIGAVKGDDDVFKKIDFMLKRGWPNGRIND